jgi:hypothetical protein
MVHIMVKIWSIMREEGPEHISCHDRVRSVLALLNYVKEGLEV